MPQEIPDKRKYTACAIYTRKSTSEGLDQNFTSLDAQRESAENYIASQKHEGWTALRERYDDGGFTGANTDRPALNKLLLDIQDGRINCVVVYKIDRLSRSLMDFAHLLQFFDNHNVTFVSVTQQFNTNTSMGRLTLNILLSFSQFEREIISERTKDKMAAARRRGQWVGGMVPIGYDFDKETKKLIMNPAEAEMIRGIYELYLQEANAQKCVTEIINENGWRTKSRTGKNGRIYGRRRFTLSHVQQLLTNVLYIGKIAYAGQIHDGQQPAIIAEETFSRVQQKIAENRMVRKASKNLDHSGLLKYILKCKHCGCFMIHSYRLKNPEVSYRYYHCTNAKNHQYLDCPNRSIHAPKIEKTVLTILREILSKKEVQEGLEFKEETAAILSSSWENLEFEKKHKLLRAVVKKIKCDGKDGKLSFLLSGWNEPLDFEAKIKKSHMNISWHKEKEIVKEPRILRDLIFAYQLQRSLDSGQVENLKKASAWLHISQSRLNHVLSLLYLSPSIQTEIVNGDPQKIGLIPGYKMISIASETGWDAQMQLWRELKHSLSDS